MKKIVSILILLVTASTFAKDICTLDFYLKEATSEFTFKIKEEFVGFTAKIDSKLEELKEDNKDGFPEYVLKQRANCAVCFNIASDLLAASGSEDSYVNLWMAKPSFFFSRFDLSSLQSYSDIIEKSGYVSSDVRRTSKEYKGEYKKVSIHLRTH